MSDERRPLVTHILVPSRTNSSPSRRAVMRMPCTSEPAPGSVIEKAARYSPAAIRGRNRCFCSSVPCDAIMPPTMYCPLTMPEIDVQPRESSAMASA